MSCPENPADCECVPPGGAGLAVPPSLTVPNFGWAYFPWELPSVLAFQPTSFPDATHASGHVITYDGRFNRLNAPVAQSQAQVDQYLEARSVQLAERALKIAAAKQDFTVQVERPWPDYPGGGIVLKTGDTYTFHPFSYPDAYCFTEINDLEAGIFTLRFRSGNGERVIRGATVMSVGEYVHFARLRNIWVPLYNAAIAQVDREYPQP